MMQGLVPGTSTENVHDGIWVHVMWFYYFLSVIFYYLLTAGVVLQLWLSVKMCLLIRMKNEFTSILTIPLDLFFFNKMKL